LPVTSSGARTLDDILANGVRGPADVDAMATLNGGEIQVLVWNYHDDIVTVAASPVHLSVKVPSAFGPRAFATHLRADETHGDAYTAWVAQGSPTEPTTAQLATLRAGMNPVLLEMPRFGISLITLAPPGPGDDASAGNGGAGGTSVVGGARESGCGCGMAAPPDRGTATLFTLALAAAFVMARRRR
jgi:MYXO-CTERM domain-containing protein